MSKIIGETSSGKRIYDSFNHPKHKNFTKDDHSDAQLVADNEKALVWLEATSGLRPKKERKGAEYKKFDKQATQHMNAYNKALAIQNGDYDYGYTPLKGIRRIKTVRLTNKDRAEYDRVHKKKKK